MNDARLKEMNVIMMNKKIVILLGVILLIIGIVCVYITLRNNPRHGDNNNRYTSIAQQNSNSEQNILVLYFSATHNTEKVAEYIAKYTNGNLVQIVPEEEYTDDDLNYNVDNTRANREQNDDKARPAIKNDIEIGQYDMIYLGYPIWWGDVPKIILTFLDHYDLSGKTIIPFCTSGGSGIETSVRTLRNYQSDIAIQDGKKFSSMTTEQDVQSWLKNN